MARLFAFIFSLFIFYSCERPDWLVQWQKKQVDKRFGRISPDEKLSQIANWQKEAQEYEEQYLKELDLQVRSSLIHRRIGSAFAELDSYEACIRHLEKAVLLGDKDAETFYRLGLCYGNLARLHNWDQKFTKNAEQNFLKSINASKKDPKGKYQLALIYYYGYAALDPYRIYGERLTISQKEYQKKAISLIQEILTKNKQSVRYRFALGGMYAGTRDNAKAIAMYRSIQEILESSYPKKYNEREDYKKATSNLHILLGSTK